MKNMMKHILMCLIVLIAASSCIENDLSYPDVTVTFTSFEVEGQKSVAIDEASRTIDIVMGESADMSEVKVTRYSVSEHAEIVGGMPEYLDLRDSLQLTLHLYEDYVWTIKASQPIKRYIRCDNQAGETVFDVDEKTAYVYVSENQSLLNVRFNDMKLEPEGSVIETTLGFVSRDGQSVPVTEACDFPMVLDCVIMRYFYVKYQGEEIRWSVKVLQKMVEVEMKSVNPWTCSAGVKGATDGKGTPAFEYRKESDAQWSKWPDVSLAGTTVTADITGLQEDTDYLVRMTNGYISSAEMSFRTGKAVQLPNLSFDNWSKDNKYPNAAGSDVWDSANSSGVTITTSPSDDSVKGKAARLESLKKFGVMAAGNIFTGSFGNFVLSGGAGASLNWGTPFSSRPLALRGYFKYSPVTVDNARKPYEDMMGKTDQSQILMFLTDWASTFTVNTATGTFVNLDSDPGIIASGQLNTSETDSDYVRFTIPLIYRSNDRIPTYVVIACASSRYGDYFTGGVGSVLLIDEFEFIYDPAELTDEEYKTVFSIVDPV